MVKKAEKGWAAQELRRVEADMKLLRPWLKAVKS